MTPVERRPILPELKEGGAIHTQKLNESLKPLIYLMINFIGRQVSECSREFGDQRLKTQAFVQRLFGMLAFGNIFGDSSEPIETACRILNWESAISYPAHRSVRPHHAILNFKILLIISFTYVSHAGPIQSEEHTSELQSLTNLVCRLLLE